MTDTGVPVLQLWECVNTDPLPFFFSLLNNEAVKRRVPFMLLIPSSALFSHMRMRLGHWYWRGHRVQMKRLPPLSIPEMGVELQWSFPVAPNDLQSMCLAGCILPCMRTGPISQQRGSRSCNVLFHLTRTSCCRHLAGIFSSSWMFSKHVNRQVLSAWSDPWFFCW